MKANAAVWRVTARPDLRAFRTIFRLLSILARDVTRTEPRSRCEHGRSELSSEREPRRSPHVLRSISREHTYRFRRRTIISIAHGAQSRWCSKIALQQCTEPERLQRSSTKPSAILKRAIESRFHDAIDTTDAAVR